MPQVHVQDEGGNTIFNINIARGRGRSGAKIKEDIQLVTQFAPSDYKIAKVGTTGLLAGEDDITKGGTIDCKLKLKGVLKITVVNDTLTHKIYVRKAKSISHELRCWGILPRESKAKYGSKHVDIVKTFSSALIKAGSTIAIKCDKSPKI